MVGVAVVDEQARPRLERAREPPEGGDVLALAEVAEAREQADETVELRAIGEPAHVAANEAKARVLPMGAAGGAKHGGREVHTHHRVAAPGKLAPVAPEAAA